MFAQNKTKQNKKILFFSIRDLQNAKGEGRRVGQREGERGAQKEERFTSSNL